VVSLIQHQDEKSHLAQDRNERPALLWNKVPWHNQPVGWSQGNKEHQSQSCGRVSSVFWLGM